MFFHARPVQVTHALRKASGFQGLCQAVEARVTGVARTCVLLCGLVLHGLRPPGCKAMQDLIMQGNMVAISRHMARDSEVLGVLQHDRCSEIAQLVREALADLQAWEPDVVDERGDALNLLLTAVLPFAIKAGITVYLLTEQQIEGQQCVVEARRVGGAVLGASEAVALNVVFLMLESSGTRMQGNQHARLFIPQQDVYLMPTFVQPGQFFVLNSSDHASRHDSECGPTYLAGSCGT